MSDREPKPVLTVVREPDYISEGHFHEGHKPHIPLGKIWSLPIGTKLYTEEQMQNRARIIEQEKTELVEALTPANDREYFDKLIEAKAAIEDLLSEQNGPPLIRRHRQWQAAVDRCRAVIQLQHQANKPKE